MEFIIQYVFVCNLRNEYSKARLIKTLSGNEKKWDSNGIENYSINICQIFVQASDILVHGELRSVSPIFYNIP